jgi:hypothetical protein
MQTLEPERKVARASPISRGACSLIEAGSSRSIHDPAEAMTLMRATKSMFPLHEGTIVYATLSFIDELLCNSAHSRTSQISIVILLDKRNPLAVEWIAPMGHLKDKILYKRPGRRAFVKTPTFAPDGGGASVAGLLRREIMLSKRTDLPTAEGARCESEPF